MYLLERDDALESKLCQGRQPRLAKAGEHITHATRHAHARVQPPTAEEQRVPGCIGVAATLYMQCLDA